MRKQFFPLLLLVFAGCKKSETEVLSSDKAIVSVQFKAADNPGLTADVAGSFSNDSIKFELPQSVSITNLIPSIDFKGRKIDPENRTPQNFTGGKKYTITAEDGSTVQYSLAITRISSDTASLVLGAWRVLKDSVVNNNWMNPHGGVLTPGVYIGGPADYWKFEPNGVFSARENGITGSNSYLLSPGKLEIPIWSIQYGLATIEKLTNTEFTVFFHATSSNGGHYHRKVYLQR